VGYKKPSSRVKDKNRGKTKKMWYNGGMKIYNNEIERIVETKIKPNLKAIYNMRIKGLKDRHIAQFLGISLQHFLKALESNTVLKDAYNDATLILSSELRNVVISRALGTDNKVDMNGELVGPDANLALRVLEKIDPEFSKQKEEVKVVISVEDVFHELNERRRLEIEKKDDIIKKNEEQGLDII